MAVYDPVSVCNMALSRVGIGHKIVALDDATAQASVCNDWYTIARDRVLAAFQWPFAQKRAALALVEEFEDDDDPDLEWAFSYRYPVTCIVLRRIVSQNRPESQPTPFELGQDNTGRLIFTDQPEAIAEYTATYDDPGEWPDAFADAVSALLATEIAGPLRVSADKVAIAMQKYDRALIRAQGIANQERRLAPQPVSKYVSVRGGGNRGTFDPMLRQG